MLSYGNNTVSGTGIRFNMNAINMKLGFKNFIDVEQAVGKSISSGLDVRLPQGRYNGHDVPVVTFQGLIDTSLAIGTARTAGYPDITLGVLGSFALIGSGYLLYPAVNIFLGKQPDAGSISTMITAVNLLPTTDYQKSGSEYIIPYNMELMIVSGPV